MLWVTAWIFPFSLIALWLIERGDRKTDQARRDLEARARMDKFDRAAQHLTVCDPWVELDREWCAQVHIDWLGTAPGSMPMRPYDPAPHTYPRRPARHNSNRLHRGF